MEVLTTKPTSLSVIVAVYNEQYLVAASLSRLRVLSESPLLGSIQIIVVDDGSQDRSASVLREFQDSLELEPWGPKFEWIFLRHPKNRGKAAAVRAGLERATGELTVFHDSDLEYHPADLLKMLLPFYDESADAVYGSRFLASDYRRVLFFRHSVGNKFLTFLCNLFSDLNLTDADVGARAGLRLETILNFNRVGVLAWWLNGKVLHRKSFSLFQIKLLNFLTPLFRRIDSWLPLPPLSLIAVFRKPDPSVTAVHQAPAHPDLAQAV